MTCQYFIAEMQLILSKDNANREQYKYGLSIFYCEMRLSYYFPSHS